MINDIKPSSGTFTKDTKPVATIGSILTVGNPIGLLLALTYASTIISDGYINDIKPNSGTFINDNKPI